MYYLDDDIKAHFSSLSPGYYNFTISDHSSQAALFVGRAYAFSDGRLDIMINDLIKSFTWTDDVLTASPSSVNFVPNYVTAKIDVTLTDLPEPLSQTFDICFAYRYAHFLRRLVMTDTFSVYPLLQGVTSGPGGFSLPFVSHLPYLPTSEIGFGALTKNATSQPQTVQLQLDGDLHKTVCSKTVTAGQTVCQFAPLSAFLTGAIPSTLPYDELGAQISLTRQGPVSLVPTVSAGGEMIFHINDTDFSVSGYSDDDSEVFSYDYTSTSHLEQDKIYFFGASNFDRLVIAGGDYSYELQGGQIFREPDAGFSMFFSYEQDGASSSTLLTIINIDS